MLKLDEPRNAFLNGKVGIIINSGAIIANILDALLENKAVFARRRRVGMQFWTQNGRHIRVIKDTVSCRNKAKRRLLV